MHRDRCLRLALAFLSIAVTAACGGESPAPTLPASAGPVARWRRGADEAEGGRPAVIEALRPCRLTIAWRFDTGLEGFETRDLATGESVRIRTSVAPAGLPVMPLPPETDRARGRTRPNSFSLRYALDDGGFHQRPDLVWTRDREPWHRIAMSDFPPTWRDLPVGVEVALFAVAVVDAVDTSDLRLDLTSPPRVRSPRPFAPDDVVHVASLVISLSPR